MNRHDWLWMAFRATGLFFIARTILLIPDFINTIRMRDLLIVPGREVEIPFAFGTEGIATCMGVYAIAAVVMFLVPVAGSLRQSTAIT